MQPRLLLLTTLLMQPAGAGGRRSFLVLVPDEGAMDGAFMAIGQKMKDDGAEGLLDLIYADAKYTWCQTSL